MTNLLADSAHIMGCASAVGKGGPSRRENIHLPTGDLDRHCAVPRVPSVRFGALLQSLQNLIGYRKVATVPGNPVKLRHAALTHSLIEIHLTTS